MVSNGFVFKERNEVVNLGGFSIWRLIGVSTFKSRISRAIGIPLKTVKLG